MRALTDHKGSSANDKIITRFISADRKHYDLHLDCGVKDGHKQVERVLLTFHTGDPSEGINGITDEVLLAIVIDRLKGWQEGPHKCRENALAQTHIETGLMWMQKRTRERQARGVEGTQEV